MYLQVVECLKCHKHYGEKNKFIPVCPHCGNNDNNETIYLSEDSNIREAFINGEEVANAK